MVPELLPRGPLRREYEGATLRENLTPVYGERSVHSATYICRLNCGWRGCWLNRNCKFEQMSRNLFQASLKICAVNSRNFSEASSRAAGSLSGSAVMACSSRLNFKAFGVRTITVPALIAFLGLAGAGGNATFCSAFVLTTGFDSILRMARIPSQIHALNNGVII